jgi:class 3 adenylate cyclase/tetratricopeptide (TPR) repeat protein
MPSCPRCGVAAEETARFCSACGTRLEGAEGRSVHSRKILTVMFADVVGFTSLAERIDPEMLQLLMSRFVGEMRQIIVRHGGMIEKLIGDAIMVLFGVPVIHEDDPARAARCALEMRTALESLNDEIEARWGERLQIHTGINTGEVMVGPGDDGQIVTYGDAVNVAKRLQEGARGEILVGPLTARLLDGVGQLVPVQPMRLKGKNAPVEAWRLGQVDEGLPRPPGPTGALVGRREELAVLRQAFDDVVATATPAAVTVTGVAGIGKSRLVGELLADVGDRAAVVAGRCLPYGEGITYWPIAEIVRRLAGRPEVSAIAEIAGGDDEAQKIAHHVARVVGMAPGTVAAEEAHWAVRRLLEIRALERPLIVVMDDIHWAEPTLLDLLDHVATHARNVPLLLVCLARPELLERAGAPGTAARSTILALGPLPDDDAAELLAELTGGSGVASADAERVLATAEGNPFFLEQIVAMRASGEGGTPPSIHALLAARVDALPSTERAVVDRAAVEGRGFHRSAIAELLPASDRPDLDAALDGLARRQLIRPGPGEMPGEAGYHFVHILVRDVVYELLPKAARADLHERYAAWLDERAGPRYAELVGYHLEQAHRWHAELRPRAVAERLPLAEQAAERLGAAAHAALQRGDLPGGVNLLRRTAELLPADAPARAPVLPELALALVQLGALPEADQLLSEAIRVARDRDDELAEAHARTAQFFALVQLEPDGAPAAISTRFDALHRTFAAASDDLGLARLYRAQAFVHWLLGRTAQADAAWKRAVRHSRMAGDEQGVADGLVWQASAAALGPRRVPAAINDCRAILDQLRLDRRSQALSMRPLASLYAMAGRFDLAHDLLDQSRAIHDELGVSLHAVLAQDEAYVALIEGDPAAAEAALTPCVAHLTKIGEKALLGTMATMLGRALVEQDRDDEAWRLTETVDEVAAPDDLAVETWRRLLRAELLARGGDPDAAERLSDEAATIAASTDWLDDRGEVLMTRGRILRSCGRPEEASRAFHQALDLFSRKGNVVSAARARAIVDELPSRSARTVKRRFHIGADESRRREGRSRRR